MLGELKAFVTACIAPCRFIELGCIVVVGVLVATRAATVLTPVVVDGSVPELAPLAVEVDGWDVEDMMLKNFRLKCLV